MPPGPPFAPRFGSCVGSLCGTVARATRRRGARSGPSGGEAAAMVLRRLARRVRPGRASPRTGGSPPRRHGRPARAPFLLHGGAALRPSAVAWPPGLLGGAPSLPRGEPFVRLASSRPCALRVLPPRVPWPRRVRPARAPFLLHGGAALPPSAV